MILNKMKPNQKAKEVLKLNKSQLKTLFSEFGDVVENDFIDSIFVNRYGYLTSVQVQKTNGINVKLTLKPRGGLVACETF